MSSLSARAPRADGRRNEQRILDAAAEAIAVDPLASLERIARRAGLSRATLYAHFSSRDALMDALTDRSVSEVAEALRAARPDEGNADEAMARVLVAASDTIGRYRGLVIVNRRLEPEELQRRTAPASSLMAPLIRRGQESGEFDTDLPATWLLTVLLELIHAASRQVTAGTMSPQVAQRALLRSARAALTSHRAANS